MYVPLRLGFFITARHCASLFFFSIMHFLEFPCLCARMWYVCTYYTYIDDDVRSRAALLAVVD